MTHELKAQLNELHSQTIQLLECVLLINTMVLPGVLYRTECLPLNEEQTRSLALIIECFIFGVVGLPSRVAKKALHPHRSHGLGLGYFPILYPTCVLDILQRNAPLLTFSTTRCLPMAPSSFFSLFVLS